MPSKDVSVGPSPRALCHRAVGTLLSSFLIVIHLQVVYAQEKWCVDNPAACVCSETLQATSYSIVSPTEFYGANETNPKKCTHVSGVTGAMMRVAFGGGGFPSISTDPTVLGRLPDRDPSKVVRFLRQAGDYFGPGSPAASTWQIGYDFGSSIRNYKRISMRFYRYHSEDFEFGHQNHLPPHNTAYQCTNGKIAHNEAVYYDTSAGFTTIQSYNNIIGGTYPFSSSHGWRWAGHTNFNGLAAWKATPGGDGSQDLTKFRGKWVRYEIVIRRPATADAQVSGYDYEVYLTNVTDRANQKQDTRFSAGCTGCIEINGVGGQNFVWNTGVYPVSDMRYLYMVLYRASETTQGGDGYCYGWDGVTYFAVAGWATDAGQLIGPAVEVEGSGDAVGPSPPPAPRIR